MTFGWGRAEIVAALVNFTTLIMIGLYLGYEAVMRLFAPEPIEGWTVVIVAGIALVIDAVTAMLTYAMSKDRMNIRAAFLHNVADGLASVGVIIGGVVVLLYDWTLIDPIITLMISGYVLWHGFAEIGGAIRILMNAAPDDLDTKSVAEAMAGIDGVAGIHHVHLWRFDERRCSLEAHVLLADDHTNAADVKQRLRVLLAEEFGVRHATLETERPDEECADPEGGIEHPMPAR
jgi:cobalt-zinc-cadmium efflux system protein